MKTRIAPHNLHTGRTRLARPGWQGLNTQLVARSNHGPVVFRARLPASSHSMLLAACTKSLRTKASPRYRKQNAVLIRFLSRARIAYRTTRQESGDVCWAPIQCQHPNCRCMTSNRRQFCWLRLAGLSMLGGFLALVCLQVVSAVLSV